MYSNFDCGKYDVGHNFFLQSINEHLMCDNRRNICVYNTSWIQKTHIKMAISKGTNIRWKIAHGKSSMFDLVSLLE